MNLSCCQSRWNQACWVVSHMTGKLDFESKVQLGLLFIMSQSFRTLEKLDYYTSTDVSGKDVGKPSLFILIYELSLCLWFELNLLLFRFSHNTCLGCKASINISHFLPHPSPACHLTFYLNHFQILSLNKPVLIHDWALT